MKYEFNFYTQYKQFYICDKTSSKKTESGDFWTDEAYNDRLAIGKGIVGIGIESYGTVNGELDILDSINDNFDHTMFDHIVEGGIEINSGELEILDCPNLSVELLASVKSGAYRIRVYSSKLGSAKYDDGNDYYKIEIWPSANMERNIIKRYVQE